MTKKILLNAMFVIFLSSVPARAQAGLYAFGGYTSKEHFAVPPFNVEINDAVTYGGGLEFIFRKIYGIEFLYQHRGGEFTVTDASTYHESEHIHFDYFLVGGLRLQPISDLLTFYGGLNMGAVNLTNAGSHEVHNRFAWGGKAGLRYHITEVVALRFQAQLMAISHGSNASVWLGKLATISFNDYAYALQFGITGGVVLMPMTKSKS